MSVMVIGVVCPAVTVTGWVWDHISCWRPPLTSMMRGVRPATW
jgi:hypothetical protein